MAFGSMVLDLLKVPNPHEQLVREAFGGGRTATPAGGVAPAQGSAQGAGPAQPDSVQSPQEIADLMVGFMERQARAQQIDRGIAGIIGAFQQPEAARQTMAAFGVGQAGGGRGGAGGDAFNGALGMIGDVMKVQQAQAAFQQQQRTRAATLASIPQLSQATGVPEITLRALYENAPDQFAKFVADVSGPTTLSEGQRRAVGNNVTIGAEYAPQTVSAGATLYDPNARQPIFSAPANEPAAIATTRGVGLDPTTPEGRAFAERIGGPSRVNVDTGTVPQGYQAVRDEQGRIVRYDPVPGGPADTSKVDAAKAAGRQLSADVVSSAADKALTALDSGGFWAAGTAGRVLSGVSESGAAEVRRNIDVLKANASIEALNAMRQASPTGGALGGVTEGEHAMLAAKAGALDPNAPPETLRQQIADYRDTLLRVIHGAEGVTSGAATTTPAGGGRDAAATPAQPFDLSGTRDAQPAASQAAPAGSQWQDIGGGYRIRAK